MEVIHVLGLIFIIASFALAAYAGNALVLYLLPARVLDTPPGEEAHEEEDGTDYTEAFEKWWLWDGGNKSGIPNIFHSDRVKPLAFAAWKAGRLDYAVVAPGSAL